MGGETWTAWREWEPKTNKAHMSMWGSCASKCRVLVRLQVDVAVGATDSSLVKTVYKTGILKQIGRGIKGCAKECRKGNQQAVKLL